jgi:hypothetical protein
MIQEVRIDRMASAPAALPDLMVGVADAAVVEPVGPPAASAPVAEVAVEAGIVGPTTDEVAALATGETAGLATDEAAGLATGGTAGLATDEAAGLVTGETAGLATDDAAGLVTGETVGSVADEATGLGAAKAVGLLAAEAEGGATEGGATDGVAAAGATAGATGADVVGAAWPAGSSSCSIIWQVCAPTPCNAKPPVESDAMAGVASIATPSKPMPGARKFLLLRISVLPFEQRQWPKIVAAKRRAARAPGPGRPMLSGSRYCWWRCCRRRWQ